MWYPDDIDERSFRGSTDCQSGRFDGVLGSGVLRKLYRKNCPSVAVVDDRKIFVLGDSHAGAYTSLLRMYALKTGAEAYILSRPGCPYLNFLRRNSDQPEDCRSFADESFSFISKHARRGDVVFLASLRLPRIDDRGKILDVAEIEKDLLSAKYAEPRAQSLVEAKGVLDLIGRLGVKIVFEAPKPVFAYPAFRCTDWFNQNNPVCAQGPDMPVAVIQRFRAPVMEAMREIVGGNKAVSIWDPLPYLCDGIKCSAVKGKPLFFDGDHLSGYGNEVLFPHFLQMMQDLKAVSTSSP